MQTPLAETVGPLVTGTGGNRGHVLVCSGATSGTTTGAPVDASTATVVGSVSEKDYMQKLSHGACLSVPLRRKRAGRRLQQKSIASSKCFSS